MGDLHYEEPALAELYDVFCGWSEDRDYYLGLAGANRLAILDLGCGTGLLCDAWAANGHAVTGVDPAGAMLDIARRKPHASRVEWVRAPAQNFRSDKRFDLIVMTGHAFQVLLTDAAVAAALETVRRHLGPGGRFVFETRNPGIDWRPLWDHDTARAVDGRTVREVTRLIGIDGDRLRFELHFAFAGKSVVVPSELRFLSRAGIEGRLASAGLAVERLTGDWQGGSFVEDASREIIVEARHAR